MVYSFTRMIIFLLSFPSVPTLYKAHLNFDFILLELIMKTFHNSKWCGSVQTKRNTFARSLFEQYVQKNLSVANVLSILSNEFA